MASKSNKKKKPNKAAQPKPETKPARPDITPSISTEPETNTNEPSPEPPPSNEPNPPETTEELQTETTAEPQTNEPPQTPELRFEINAEEAPEKILEVLQEAPIEAPPLPSPAAPPSIDATHTGQSKPSQPKTATPWRLALWLAAVFSSLLGDNAWMPRVIIDLATSTSFPAAAEIFGQVTDEAGAPLANASLQLGQIVGAQATLGGVTLDEQGAFRYSSPGLGRFRAKATAPGYGTVETEVVLTEKRPRVELLLRLPPSGSLLGQVVDAKGNPIEDAFVGASLQNNESAPPRYVQTDENGNFVIENVARDTWLLFARTPLGLTSEVQSAIAPATGIRLVIPTGSTIAGTFIDALQSKPVGNAKIRLGGSGLWPPKEVSTDADGNYRFAGVPAGVYTIIGTAKRADGVPLYSISEGVDVKANSLRDAVSLYANPAWELRGEVTDDTGHLLAGAELLLSEDPHFVVARRAFSDPTGKFSFEGIPSGDVFIRVLSDDLPPSAAQKILVAPAFREVIVIDKPESPDAIDLATMIASTATPPANIFAIELSVPKGQTIIGQVVNEEGRPVSGAYVLLRDPKSGEIIGDPSPRRAFARWEAEHFGASSLIGDASRFVTGTDGKFAVFGVREGDVVAVAQLAGYPVASSLCVVGAACRVVMTDADEIKGRVIDEQGFPVSGAKLRAAPEQNATFQVLYTEAASDGTFTLSPVGALVDIRVRAPGYAPKTVKQISPTNDLEIVLTVNDATLSGRVVDERGFPIERASVEAKVEEFASQIITAQDGTFTFTEVPKGEVQLKVTKAGYAPLQTTGEGDALELVLLEGATLLGQVLDEDRNILPFAQVELVYPDGTSVGTFSATGSFTLSELPPGRASLQVVVTGYVTEQRWIVLKPSEEIDVEVTMRQSGILRGKITNQDGSNASSAKIKIEGEAGKVQETTSGKDGNFFFSAVPPGKWKVLAQRTTQGAIEENVEVSANETTKINLQLKEGVTAIEEKPQGFSIWGATFAKQKNKYVVIAVEPDSPADISDLFVGDIIQSIDGVKTNDLTQEQFLEQMKTAVQIFVVSKEGELQEVELRR
jgi:hypothetical protein